MSKRILFILVVLALAWSTTADVQAKSKKKGRFADKLPSRWLRRCGYQAETV